MKYHAYLTSIAMIAALGVFLTGCKPSSEKAEISLPSTIETQLAELQTATDTVINNLSAYTYEQKQDLVMLMETQLAGLKSSLDALSTTIAQSDVGIRAEARSRLGVLQAKHNALERQLDAIKASDASTWDLVKTTTSHAYDDLKKGFNDMRQWLSEKMAP